MTKVTLKNDPEPEESPKAPQRSSSAGRILSRLFSKSPSANEPRSASENSPNALPVPLMDSHEFTPQAPTRLAGPRWRTPRKNRVATIRVDDQQPGGTSKLTQTSPHPIPQQQQYKDLLTA